MGGEVSKGLSGDDLDELKSSTKFDSKEIKEWYDKFNQDFPDGVIHEEEFIDMYSKMCPKGNTRQFASNVFKAYDKDGNGEIDFQEFMVTLSVSSRGSPEEKLRWAFNMYDADKNGNVSLEEVIEMISAIYRMRGKFEKYKAEDAAQKIFVHLDKNNDGEISEDEFIAGALKSPNIMATLEGK